MRDPEQLLADGLKAIEVGFSTPSFYSVKAGKLVVDVSGNGRLVDILAAIEAVTCAAEKVSNAGSGLDYSKAIRAVGEELAWQLVRLTGHADVGGNEIVYRNGPMGVAVAVTQVVTNMRHVERRIRYEVQVMY